jgi:hypothetical protein
MGLCCRLLLERGAYCYYECSFQTIAPLLRTTFYSNNGITIHSRQFYTTWRCIDSGGLGRRGVAGSTARGRHNAGASSRGPQGP